MLTRLREWTFSSKDIELHAPSDTPTAQRDFLHNLSTLQTSDTCTVWFREWRWSLESVQVLAESRPTLQHLRLDIKVGQAGVLTDSLLDAYLLCGARSPVFPVRHNSLNSDKHVNTAWPWEELSVEFLEMTSVLRLPRPSSARGGTGVISTSALDLCFVREVSDMHEMHTQGRGSRVHWSAWCMATGCIHHIACCMLRRSMHAGDMLLLTMPDTCVTCALS